MGMVKREEQKQQSILWDVNVLKAARCVVHYTPGLTLNELVNQAVVREIKRREKLKGESFPIRKVRLTPGRTVKLD